MSEKPKRTRGPKGEGSVVPVRNEQGEIVTYRIQFPAKDAQGRSYRFEQTMPIDTTKAQAAREKRRLLQLRDRGKLQRTSRETVESVITRWLDWLEENRPRNTARTYRVIAVKHILPAIGHHTVSDLKRLHVFQLIEDLLQADQEPTAKTALIVVRGALAWLMDRSDGVLDENVAEIVKVAQVRRSLGRMSTPATPRALPSGEHVAALLEHTSPHPFGLVLTLLARHGLRLGEALGLASSLINWQTGEAIIQQNLTYNHGFELGPPKRKTSRPMFLAADELARLELLDRSLAKQRLVHGRTLPGVRIRASATFTAATDLLFLRKTSRPFLPETIRRFLESACQELGIPPMLPHDLRHYFDNELVMAGVDDATRWELMGHQSSARGAAMDRVYLHSDPRRKRAASEAVAARLRASGE